MSIDFNEEQILTLFDSKRIHNEEAQIISYFKQYKNRYIVDAYFNVYEETLIISAYKEDHHTTIFNVSFTHVVQEITCDKNSIKIYKANNILLAQLFLEPMISIKLSIKGNI